MLTLREASVRLGRSQNFLAAQRHIRKWPEGITLKGGPHYSLLMDENDLPKLQEYYSRRVTFIPDYKPCIKLLKEGGYLNAANYLEKQMKAREDVA
jgi:hypothetical protein